MAIKNIGVLAFASAAVAAGHNHYQHNHLHARGTGAPAAIPTGLPACWGTCFQKAGAKGPDALCGDAAVTDCIKATCADADTAAYEAWLAKQCGSGAPYPTGGNNGTAVGPTATGSSSGISTSICTETSTLIYKTTTQYSTYLITHTIYPDGSTSDVAVGPATETSPAAPTGYPTGAPGGGEGSPIGGGEGETCSDVTVTTTERTTVTVTAGSGGEGGASSYSAPAYSAPPAVPSAPASSSSAYVAPPPPASSPASPETTSAAAPPPYSAPAAPSSEAAPSSYVSEAAPPQSYAPSTYEPPSTTEAATSAWSSAAASTSSSSSSPSSPPTYDGGFRGKRGIAYNDSSMVIPALTDNTKIGWSSNWEGISKGLDVSGVTYIPTLHSSDSYWTGMWTEQAEAAISQGLPYLFGPNEPDIPSQANMLPADTADFWRTWMEPYAGRIGLVAPSVSSGVGSGIGIDWLKQFMGNCTDCTIDAVNQHWYNSEGNDVQNFKDTIDAAAAYGKPVFVGEFGAIGSDEEISSFMGEVMDYMDDNGSVIGYAYFMVYQGLLVDGDALSPYGETYCG